MTIVVTGATGQLGGAVVRHLLERLPANEIVASVRDPRGAGDLGDLGVGVRHGDFDRPETLSTAFAGASAVLIVSTPIGSVDRIGQHTAAAHAARDAGAGRIVYTSMTAATTGRNLLAGTHKHSEEAIRATGVPYTFLRNNWYLENDLGTVLAALATGTVATSTRGGRFAPVSYDDLAQATAEVLAGEGHENAVYELGSPVSYGYADFAEAIAAASGREITHTEVSDDQATDGLTAAGLPGGLVEVIVDFYRAVARGEYDTPTGDLAKLIGHEPVTLQEWVERVVTAQQA